MALWVRILPCPRICDIMDDKELMVTIRCLAYNHEPYIRQCLDGFVMQKTNFRFEAVVHDDASTDGTAAIIKEYAEKYPNIIKPIFENENQYRKRDGSLKRIMNEHTHGKYVALCEGDDYWIDPLKLQKQVDFMEANSDFFLCGTNGLIKYEGIKKQDKYFNDIVNSKELFPQDIIGKWILPTAGLLFKKEIYIDYPEWTNKVYSGDQTLILLSMNKGCIYAFSDICCVYRRDAGNTSSVSMNIRKSKSRAYVISQSIILYEEFYKYTGTKYEKYILPLLSNLRKREKVYKLMDRSVLLAAISYPYEFLKILRNRKYNK